ncbi:hypothetical protein H6P81_006679 [Aristolochia fimbriata]|uniref:Ubiquitin-like protease family profile domain-containing protein n=1 Tax=Aristolochia fimbriata TaxID=158543 RepID=A0AAV7F055_ARIFI|nr:hypothetical protein H6P81_006679 [Aristolochia fimbriata]
MRCIGISSWLKWQRRGSSGTIRCPQQGQRNLMQYAVDVASALKEEMVSRGFLDATEFELVTVEDHPHQKTGYDCGIFMVKYMDFLSRDGCDLNFTQDDIPRFIGEIAAYIIRGHLKVNVSMVVFMVYMLTVDVQSSNSALQSMLQAHGVPHDHGYELCPGS